ncbi:hypothetical protein AK812_SmicGene10290 [Symbiodinium microadriaticum]|uniref:Uncharacterized protein n=1 Tax=Symbiodinium microadriaticum TaxID=2951 RepID=A0A1Q9EGA7_SYMMI|nr:hypothetical protein AK812_SmicGene10290 [Symbiodinium microadriaticum]CAE7849030.1 unnamed protein product [Symbiodinium microadriaticum]
MAVQLEFQNYEGVSNCCVGASGCRKKASSGNARTLCKEPKHWMTVDPSYEGDSEQNAPACSDLRQEASGMSEESAAVVSGLGRPCAKKLHWFRQPKRVDRLVSVDPLEHIRLQLSAAEGTEAKCQLLRKKGWTGDKVPPCEQKEKIDKGAPEGTVLLVQASDDETSRLCIKCYYIKRGSFAKLKLMDFLAILNLVPSLQEKFLASKHKCGANSNKKEVGYLGLRWRGLRALQAQQVEQVSFFEQLQSEVHSRFEQVGAEAKELESRRAGDPPFKAGKGSLGATLRIGDEVIDISDQSLYEPKPKKEDEQVLRKINLTGIDKFLTPEMKKQIDDDDDKKALLTTLENDAKVILAKIGYINKKTGSGYITTKKETNHLKVNIKFKGKDESITISTGVTISQFRGKCGEAFGLKRSNNSKLNGKKVKEAGIIFCSNINIALV